MSKKRDMRRLNKRTNNYYTKYGWNATPGWWGRNYGRRRLSDLSTM